MSDINAIVTKTSDYPLVQQTPQTNPTQGMLDLSPEIKKAFDDSSKAQARASKMNMIASILQGAGMLGNMVNGLYQQSKGRIPLEIGNPLVGIGSILGGYGKSQSDLAAKKMTQGMIDYSGMKPEVRAMLQAQASIDPQKALTSALDTMTEKEKSLSLVDLSMRAAAGDQQAKAAIAEYRAAHPVGGGMVIMPSNQMKNADRIAELTAKKQAGIATKEETIALDALTNMTIKDLGIPIPE